MPIVLPTPQLQTERERKAREASHLPTVACREHCQRGEEASALHFRVPSTQHSVVDPMFMNASAQLDAQAYWQNVSFVTLVAVDDDAKSLLMLTQSLPPVPGHARAWTCDCEVRH